jgi:hypothetical protein
VPEQLVSRVTLLLIVVLSISMVQGATRSSTRDGVVRESLRSFVGLAGGLALLVVCVELVLLVVQSDG